MPVSAQAGVLAQIGVYVEQKTKEYNGYKGSARGGGNPHPYINHKFGRC